MRHSLQAEDFGLRLRPVQMDDAMFIVWLRNLDHVRGRVGDSAIGVTAQETWLKAYFEREGDYYFIVETPDGIPLGTHGIYDMNGASAETGRYIMRPDVMAGVPTSVMALDLAFGPLRLRELRSTSVSTNLKVHSLHRKSGFKQVGIKRAAQFIDGEPVDLVQFLLTAEDWFKVRDRQLPLAQLAGTQVLGWAKSQSAVKQPWIESKNMLLPALNVTTARDLEVDWKEALGIGDAAHLEAFGCWCSAWLERANAELFPVLQCF